MPSKQMTITKTTVSKQANARVAPQWGIRATMWSLLLCSSLLLNACTALTEPVDKPYIIDMTKTNSFYPATIVVPTGSTVVWKNRDFRVHSTVLMPELAMRSSEAEGQPALMTDGWDSGDVLPGETWEHHFTAPGTYLFACRFHEGMIGTIIVTDTEANVPTSTE